MTVAIIAAISNNNVIGVNNQLPWRLPADMVYFRTMTMGKSIVMGRKTWESLNKALPGRRNIVISRQPSYVASGAEVVSSLEDALNLTKNEGEVMIIGGAMLYKQALSLAEKLYITFVQIDCEGDVFFPDFLMSEWQEISRENCQADDKNPHNYSFVVYRRHV